MIYDATPSLADCPPSVFRSTATRQEHVADAVPPADTRVQDAIEHNAQLVNNAIREKSRRALEGK